MRPVLINVALLLALLGTLVGLGVLKGPGMLRSMLHREVGDVLWVRAEAAGYPLPTMDVGAVVVSAPGLVPGSRCALGVGGAAAQGGTLVILRYDPAEGYTAAWAGPGPSTRVGKDCGRTAELRLSVHDVQE
ncbi:MAG TPA: hypothetical protein VE650_11610, partial [Acetobacteraceae bacterium]|nr:hypothetical protein [Acetobacteraceae bacterium]